jgi:hypothetical protein
VPVHEALLAESCLLEICQGPIRGGSGMTDNSEGTVVIRWDEKCRSPNGMLYAPQVSTRSEAQEIKETGYEED